MKSPIHANSTLLLKLSQLKQSAPQQTPVLDLYFADKNLPGPADLYDLIPLDQQQCWLNGQRRPPEDYLQRFPELSRDPERLLNLVYFEYLLQQQFDPPVNKDVFLQRFPMIADSLAKQIQFHETIESVSGDDSRVTGSLGSIDDTLDSKTITFTSTTIGRYQLMHELGAGNMGDLYVAQDTQLDRQVAIKIPKQELDHAHDSGSRFLREAKALAAIRHPNICPIYDFGEHNGQQFIVMPLLPGRNLASYLKLHPKLSTADSLHLIARIARALETVHQVGIAHRDLKPANIILDDDFTPIVVDFGLVKFQTQQHECQTATGVVAGTPAYLAPERLKDDKNVNQFQADIYSLGVILYELITGVLPYQANSGSEYLARLLTETPRSPSALVAGLPPGIDEMCMKALAKSPSDRFASMSDFATALESLQSTLTESPAAVPPSTQLPTESPPRSSRITILIVCAAILVIGFFSGPYFFRANRISDDFRLTAGETLTGNFTFRSDGSTGDAELLIEQTEGTHFTGTYRTENGEYRWKVKGTLSNDHMEFELNQALTTSAELVDVAGRAVVSGTLSQSQFDGEYRDQDSEATITLFRRAPQRRED